MTKGPIKGWFLGNFFRRSRLIGRLELQKLKARVQALETFQTTWIRKDFRFEWFWRVETSLADIARSTRSHKVWCDYCAYTGSESIEGVEAWISLDASRSNQDDQESVQDMDSSPLETNENLFGDIRCNIRIIGFWAEQILDRDCLETALGDHTTEMMLLSVPIAWGRCKCME